jgi:hypothetical protein
MVATKGNVIEGRAAEILQAMTRRKAEKGLVNKKMENAGDILGGFKKERAANKVKAATKGSKNPKLIFKKNHDRGVKAAESEKNIKMLCKNRSKVKIDSTHYKKQYLMELILKDKFICNFVYISQMSQNFNNGKIYKITNNIYSEV